MIEAFRNLRVALAHDWLVGLRGGERVLDRLARLLGPCDLYTLVTDGRALSEAIDACRAVPSPLQRLPGAAGRLRRWYLPLYPWAVERLRVRPCDLLVSTSSAVMKSIRPPPGARHLCYCHTPARYIWEQGVDYGGGWIGGLRTAGLALARRRFQRWDRRTAVRVDGFIANSAHTAARIRRCFGREAQVVYPPVRTEFFTPGTAAAREEFFLVVAALEPYKRTELVIDAAIRLGVPLKIAGGGSQLPRLRRLARPGVELLGRVSDEGLRDLYRRARALVFPQVEDFGIVPVEAQACGCPVIAYRAGGALETVSEHTGVFFDRQEAGLIAQAMRELDHRSISEEACREQASRFSEEAFDAAMIRQITQWMGRGAPTVGAGG
jgi:glycosyltransferase involved in cell wall biosynthesis